MCIFVPELTDAMSNFLGLYLLYIYFILDGSYWYVLNCANIFFCSVYSAMNPSSVFFISDIVVFNQYKFNLLLKKCIFFIST